MDINQSAQKIEAFERRVMWRKRLLSLQDQLAIAVLSGGLVAAALVLYVRLRPAQFSAWVVAASAFGVALLIAFAFWFSRRATEREASFLIDSSLGLEDRIATSQAIIERGGPRNEFEEALIEDAAERITDKHSSSVVPYRVSRWYGFSFIAIVALVVALMIPERVLPGGEELAAAREDIRIAAEYLEQTATEIEQAVPPESETARLAKEQAELGRSLRVSDESRAEVLKKLGALEERIRRRHDELKSTRADEIVSLADQRLRAASAEKPTRRRSEAALDEGEQMSEEAAASSDTPAIAPDKSSRRNKRGNNRNAASSAQRNANDPRNAEPVNQQTPNQQASSNRSGAQSNQTGAQAQAGGSQPQNRPQEPVSGGGQTRQAGGNQQPTGQTQESQQAANQTSQPAQQQNQENNQQAPNSQQAPNNQQGPSGPTGFMAEQAAKALPQMSAELMKKAAELRAGQLNAEDIRSLQQAAQFLARDLSKIAESKEFQEMVEQLARQVTPEQIEQVARELMRNEQLMRELQATADMIMRNQETREMVAGLARDLRQIGEQMRGANRERGNGSNISQRNREQQGRAGRGPGRGTRLRVARGESGQNDEGKLAGQGKEVKLGGNLQRKDGGEYLYLKSKADAGAARAPYSSAYPQYRREAERSVERSQVPPHLRSVVRRYFDAINPDAKKQP